MQLVSRSPAVADRDTFVWASSSSSPAHTSPGESELLSLPSGLSDIAAVEAQGTTEVEQSWK